jgi:hypothetical protein
MAFSIYPKKQYVVIIRNEDGKKPVAETLICRFAVGVYL